MRGDRTAASAEVERVAARVRALLGTDDETAPIGHAGAEPLELGEPLLPRSRVGDGPTLGDRVMARFPVRLDPGRRGALAVGVAVLLAAIVTGVWLMSSRPRAVPVSASVPRVPGAGALVGTDGATESTAAATSGTATQTSTAITRVVVDVAGKVRHPGVYRLPSGSRVDDAVQAAGGPRGRVDLSSLNLAAPLVDGQQVAVGVPAAAGGAVAGSSGGLAAGSSAGATGTVVALNSATLEQLESLPGVGPVLGQDILDYRNQHGSFSSVDQLKDVSGIGDVKFAEISPLVTL